MNIAVRHFQMVRDDVRQHAAEKLAKVKRHPRPDFESVVYVTDQDGEEWEIRVGICYDAIYEPAYLSGPPEDCYPDSSEMDIHDVIAMDDLPAGITDQMVMEAAETDRDRLEQEAWDHFLSQGEGE